MAVSVLATLFALAAHYWSQEKCDPYCRRSVYCDWRFRVTCNRWVAHICDGAMKGWPQESLELMNEGIWSSPRCSCPRNPRRSRTSSPRTRLSPTLSTSRPPCPPNSPRSSSPHTRTVPGSLVSLSWSAPSRPFTCSARPRNNNSDYSPHSTPTPSSTRIPQPSTALYSPQSQHSFSPSRSATPWVNHSTTPHVDRLPLSSTPTSLALQPSPLVSMPSTPLPPLSTRTSTRVRDPPPSTFEDPRRLCKLYVGSIMESLGTPWSPLVCNPTNT